MRQQLNNIVKKALLLTVTILLLMSAAAYPQNNEERAKSKYPFAIDNLNKGISSENVGLRRSAIYMAGFYKIDGSVETLINQLHNETHDATKVLIALTLYQIGNEKGIEEIKRLSETEPNYHVRHMYAAVCDEFVKEMNANMASK